MQSLANLQQKASGILTMRESKDGMKVDLWWLLESHLPDQLLPDVLRLRKEASGGVEVMAAHQGVYQIRLVREQAATITVVYKRPRIEL